MLAGRKRDEESRLECESNDSSSVGNVLAMLALATDSEVVWIINLTPRDPS